MKTLTATGHPVLPDREWPGEAVVAEALADPAWQPLAFDEFVLKVHGRCNLSCDYCYMYELADQSWRDKPAVMAPGIFDAAMGRIADHAAAHDLESVTVVFHGGEPLAFVLRAGNAGSNTAADHIDAARLGLAQLPRRLRRRVLIRADSGGGTQDFLAWLTKPGRRLAYSVGFTITEDVQAAILAIPAAA